MAEGFGLAGGLTAAMLVAGVFAIGAFVIILAIRHAIVLPRQPLRGPRPPPTSHERERAQRLMTHLEAIASEPHNVAHPEALEAAARHIEATLMEIGLTPTAQEFVVDGVTVRNIEVVLEPPGASPATPTIVIGAHYDAPDDSPGANDNGSGVAALLEIARDLAAASFQPGRARLRIAFFVNEEQPYGKTPDMGSLRFAERLKASGERVEGMIALETLGFFSEERGSQRFPFPFGLVFPDRGNFVAFVGLPGSRAFLHRAIASFRRQGGFPSIGGVAPGLIEGIDLSDHWSFHRMGYPALMITDTAPFRNPYYHEPDDLPETVDTESLARIVDGLLVMVRDLTQ